MKKLFLFLFLACNSSETSVCRDDLDPSTPVANDASAGVSSDSGDQEGESEIDCDSACKDCGNCLANTAPAQCDHLQVECISQNKSCAILVCCLADCSDESICYSSDCADPACGSPISACSSDKDCLSLLCSYGDCLNQVCGFALCADQAPRGSCAQCMECL